jgi:hypothetical protein
MLWVGSAKDISALSALRGCSFPQLADGTFLRKWNLYHATDSAARYPRETLRRFAAPSIPLGWAVTLK